MLLTTYKNAENGNKEDHNPNFQCRENLEYFFSGYVIFSVILLLPYGCARIQQVIGQDCNLSETEDTVSGHSE